MVLGLTLGVYTLASTFSLGTKVDGYAPHSGLGTGEGDGLEIFADELITRTMHVGGGSQGGSSTAQPQHQPQHQPQQHQASADGSGAVGSDVVPDPQDGMGHVEHHTPAHTALDVAAPPRGLYSLVRGWCLLAYAGSFEARGTSSLGAGLVCGGPAGVRHA